MQINEIELNPAGDDPGNEWVEIFIPESVNLSGYILKNNDGDELNLEGVHSGYYVVEFSKQWLDNTDEKVSIIKDGKIIEESPIVKDTKNDLNSWSRCSEWVFIESSKGSKNNCESLDNDTVVPESSSGDEKNLNNESSQNASQESEPNNLSESADDFKQSENAVSSIKENTQHLSGNSVEERRLSEKFNPQEIKAKRKNIKREESLESRKNVLEKISPWLLAGFGVFITVLSWTKFKKYLRDKKNEFRDW